LGTTAAFASLALARGLQRESGRHRAAGLSEHLRRFRELIGAHPRLRAYLAANALWELALAALKAFVVLYLREGLGYSLVTASLIVGGTGAIVLAGSAVAGTLGDRFGRVRVMRCALWIYGAGFAVPLLFTSKPVIACAVPAIALGGGAVMALAYALLTPLMPEDERGVLTGFYSVSRGIGITIGPVAAGALISLTAGNVFEQTHGYQATWIVPLVAILGSLPLLGRLDQERERR
jgi:MFS family permease